jgi:beta-phosphoglucomutase
MKYAFLFDMDGVIIDSNPYHKIALKQFCQQHGHNLSEEQLREKIYGRTNKDWIPNVLGNLTREQVQQYANEKEALFRELYRNDIKPLKGLLGFLEQAVQHNIPQAIATSAPRANVDFTLQHTSTGKYFQAILDESFVNKGKPDPEIYLKTAAALGYDPRNCVVFEDSLSGVESGKAAGCKVVGLTTTHSAEELSRTDLTIRDFDELAVDELLKKLF